MMRPNRDTAEIVHEALARAIEPHGTRTWSRAALADAVEACEALDLDHSAVTGWRRGQRVPAEGLPPLTLLRVSALLGVDRALRIVLGEGDQARRWVHAPNTGPVFGGLSPRHHMEGEGLAGLLAVRAHLDGWRGGAWAPPVDSWGGEVEPQPLRVFGA
jgi:hypothetical protein